MILEFENVQNVLVKENTQSILKYFPNRSGQLCRRNYMSAYQTKQKKSTRFSQRVPEMSIIYSFLVLIVPFKGLVFLSDKILDFWHAGWGYEKSQAQAFVQFVFIITVNVAAFYYIMSFNALSFALSLSLSSSVCVRLWALVLVILGFPDSLI